MFFNIHCKVTHSFFNVAGEDVNLKFLRTPVTLREAETVTFHGALPSTGAEQHLVDGKGGDLCT